MIAGWQWQLASEAERGFSLSGAVSSRAPDHGGHESGGALPPAVGGARWQTEVSDQPGGHASRRDPGPGPGDDATQFACRTGLIGTIWKWRWNDDLDGGSGERQHNAGLLAGLLFLILSNRSRVFFSSQIFLGFYIIVFSLLFDN